MRKTILVWLLCCMWMPVCFADYTLLVLGDSLSAAHGIDPQKGWVALLQKSLQKTNPSLKVINVSVGSDTTLDGVLKLPSVLQKFSPRCVIVELGGNDGLRGLPIAQMKANLAKIIKQLQDKKIKVILVGVKIPPNYGPEYTRQFATVYHDLAKLYSVILVPQILENIGDHPDLMQADGIHPNENGQKIMLENVLKVYDFKTPLKE